MEQWLQRAQGSPVNASEEAINCRRFSARTLSACRDRCLGVETRRARCTRDLAATGAREESPRGEPS